MATFTYNSNTSFDLDFIGARWNEYTVSGSGNTITMTASVPFGLAEKIVLTYSGRTVEEGSEPGQPATITTAGRLTGVSFFTEENDPTPALTITGLSIDAIYFDAIREAGYGNLAIQTLLTGTSNTINGTTNADVILTYNGADRVLAGTGNDLILDNGGRDTYEGGDGFDTVSYENHWFRADFSRGIVANLSKNTVSANGQTDRLISIEQVIGSHRADVITGSNGNDIFIGKGGNDTFRGSAGIDTADYARDALGESGGFRGISADLSKGTIRDGFGGRDTVSQVENVNGTLFRDTITGSKDANTLTGNGGNDALNGLAGHDTLHGGLGVDTLNGGDGNDVLTGDDGADVFMFRDTTATTGLNIGNDTITDFENGTDRINLVTLADAFGDLTVTADGSNTVIRIAGVTGSITLENVAASNVEVSDFILA